MDNTIASSPEFHAIEIYVDYTQTFTPREVNGTSYTGIPESERIPAMKYAAGEGKFWESTIRDAYSCNFLLSGEYVQTNVYQVILYGNNRITQRSGYMGVLSALQSTFKLTAWEFVNALETQTAQNKGWISATERAEIESHRPQV